MEDKTQVEQLCIALSCYLYTDNSTFLKELMLKLRATTRCNRINWGVSSMSCVVTTCQEVLSKTRQNKKVICLQGLAFKYLMVVGRCHMLRSP